MASTPTSSGPTRRGTRCAGCTKISAGCDHCYAERFAERFRGVPGHPYEQGFDLRLVPETAGRAARWKRPSMIFVNSMSDLFHEDVPDDYVEPVCRHHGAADWHTYQVLTKRVSRCATCSGRLRFAAACRTSGGASASRTASRIRLRIRAPARAPAAVRFLSVEPLLEDLGKSTSKASTG